MYSVAVIANPQKAFIEIKTRFNFSLSHSASKLAFEVVYGKLSIL